MSLLQQPVLFSLRRIIAVAVLLGGTTATPAEGGEDTVHFCEYEIIVAELDPCCGCLGPPNSTAQGMNDLRQAVGHFDRCEPPGDTAFFWSGGPDIITLDFPWSASRTWAFDINNARQIVGMIEISDDEFGRLGYLLDGNDVINLGTLPGGTFSEATAINEHGQVAGTWGNNVTGDPGLEAFFWENGVMTGLGPILGTDSSSGEDINDLGWVTGWMGSFATSRAFIWNGTDVIELTTPYEIISSKGRAISNRGEVAGWIHFHHSTGTSLLNAALWRADGHFINLGRLPDHHYCRAYALNERSEVVGSCGGVGVHTEAFMWRGGVMVKLDSLVRDLPTPIALAYAINEHGMIAGSLRGGNACILVPIDPPLTDLTGDCRTRADDLVILLAEWGEPGPADFNDSGTVDTADLLLLLHHWD